MSKGSRHLLPGKSLLGLTLVLALSGLLLVPVGCVDLTSDTASPTSTTTTEESTLGASLDATSTTEAEGVATGTTETTAPGTESGGGGGGPVPWDSEVADPEESLDDSTFTVFPFETTTTEREPDYWTFDEDNDGQHRTIHVGDIVTVELEFTRFEQVTDTRWGPGSSSMLDCVSHDVTTGLLGRYIIGSTDVFLAYAPGDCRLLIISWHERDSEYHTWQVYLEVTE